MPMLQRILTIAIVFAITGTASAVTQKQVEDGIERLKIAIYKLQTDDGSFETKPKGDGGHAGAAHGGETAMAVYALITAGESYQDPRIKKAIKWLAENEITGTYALGVRCHVWSHLPEQFMGKLKEDIYKLDQWKAPPPGAEGGSIAWSYGDKIGSVHTSSGQYGVLGFWEGAKRGIPISSADWKAIEAYYTTSQNPDGGWGYRYKGESRLSMACAGMTCLYITQDYAHRDEYKNPGAYRKHPLTKHLEEGLVYMDKQFKGGQALYTLYGVERVGLASGRKRFGGKDWFAVGAEQILKTMGGGNGPFGLQDHGYKMAGHAFALLFLVRGGVPVMVNKLEIPDYDWNNRPRDLANLTAWVSDTVEQEVNWQVQSIEDDPDTWNDAPMLYLASHYELDLSDEHKAKIKKYIDAGGLLITVADRASRGFSGTVTKLMQDLYPGYEYTPLDPTDELSNTVFNVNTARMGVKTLHNGARHMAVHIERGDVSWAFHARQHADPAPWQFMVNCYHYATSKRGAVPRLSGRPIPRLRGKGDNAPPIKVARAVYGGNHNPEPLAWERLSIDMHNDDKAKLTTVSVNLGEIGQTDAKLVHVAGTDEVEFTPSEIAALQAYIANGGVVVFENVGGRGPFATSVMGMLRQAYPKQRLRPISLESPVITGKGIGGEDASSVRYRLFAQLRMGDVDTPRLLTLNFDGEPRIIVSGEDLSLGMLGTGQWGVFGYDTASSKKLMSNLALWSSKRTLSPAPAAAASE